MNSTQGVRRPFPLAPVPFDLTQNRAALVVDVVLVLAILVLAALI